MIECQCESKGLCPIFNRQMSGREVQVCQCTGANASVERTSNAQEQWAAASNQTLVELENQYPATGVEKSQAAAACCGQPQGLASRIKQGVGLLKAVVGANPADDEVIAKRLEACYACDYHHLGRCLACTCFVAPKAHVADSNCPHDRWDVST